MPSFVGASVENFALGILAPAKPGFDPTGLSGPFLSKPRTRMPMEMPRLAAGNSRLSPLKFVPAPDRTARFSCGWLPGRQLSFWPPFRSGYIF